MAPITAATDTPRATLRRRNASATASKGPRQLPRRRTQLRDGERQGGRGCTARTAATGCRRRCWKPEPRRLEGPHTARAPPARRRRVGRASSDRELTSMRAATFPRTKAVTAAPATAACGGNSQEPDAAPGIPGTLSGVPVGISTVRGTEVGGVTDRVLEMVVRQRVRRHQGDQQAVTTRHRIPPGDRDVRGHRVAWSAVEIPSECVDIGLAVGGRKRLPDVAGVGRHEGDQEWVASRYRTAVGRTLRDRGGPRRRDRWTWPPPRGRRWRERTGRVSTTAATNRIAKARHARRPRWPFPRAPGALLAAGPPGRHPAHATATSSIDDGSAQSEDEGRVDE